MQHTKITDNLGEFQKFRDNDNKTGLYQEDTIKQSGIMVSEIMTTLLMMLFYRSRNSYRKKNLF